jgi:hypothetical protein|tara:strand:+ start:5261 stop:5974 length:714 start_codon:yes stop_codon:yes gene_type:complete
MADYISLLKSEIPEYETKLPASKKTVKYRPFLVKEEKILLVAKQNKDKKEQISAIENVILSCCNLKNIDKLPLVDVEHMFLELRKRSIGERINLNFNCPETKETIQVNLDLNDINLSNSTNKKTVTLSGTKKIIFKDYTFEDFKKSFSILKTKSDEIVFLMSKLETPTEIIDCDTLSNKQKTEVIDNLLPSEYKKIINESNKVKRYEHTIKYETQSGEEKSLLIRGLFDFFCLPSAI